ncbi:MAG: lipopolysaccharide heptosyltransferase RfaC [Oceanospirillaceae bacterium]|nr:lipopolysaccharide heptosyltransferase RfaC [Oceanospirillaceae bacterium]
MRVLVVKTSSMGDIIHTLPALTDAMRAIEGIRFDWVVEEGFQEIPRWHAAVDNVIPVAIRRWRKHPIQAWRSGQWQAFKQQLQAQHYDAVIDAQGLLKSAALVVRNARGKSYGLDKDSAKEPLASRFYQQPINVAKDQHAIERTRQLFALSLGYSLEKEQQGDFNISSYFSSNEKSEYLVFNHGTTRFDKHYPQVYWQQLITMATEQGWQVKLPWGSDTELARAIELAAGNPKVTVLDKLSLSQVAQVIADAAGCISVDTGLSHLSAALDKPNLTLFGPTDPGLVGGYGKHQQVLQASDYTFTGVDVEPKIFSALTPSTVWHEFHQLINSSQQ